MSGVSWKNPSIFELLSDIYIQLDLSMKKELLEYLIRECVREVLEAFPQEPETVGAPAPPAAGQGTADQPPIPQQPAASPEGAPLMPGTTGLFYVDPKKPQKPAPLKVQAGDPATLERQLYRTASRSGGPRVKISSAALREVPKVLANPNSALFLYIGKQNEDDPDDELYLLPARTLQQAQADSVGAGVSAEHPTTSLATVDPNTGEAPQGKTMAPDIDESSKLHNMISTMVREALQEARKK